MAICKTLAHWCHVTKPEKSGYDLGRWEAEQHPKDYVRISKLHGHHRVTVTFTTIEVAPNVVAVRCNSNWKAEDEPRGWYHRRDAVALYRSLIAEGYCDDFKRDAA